MRLKYNSFWDKCQYFGTEIIISIILRFYNIKKSHVPVQEVGFLNNYICINQNHLSSSS